MSGGGWVCTGGGMSGEMGIPGGWLCPGSTHIPGHRTWDTIVYGRQVGGMHSTGMLSCVIIKISTTMSNFRNVSSSTTMIKTS